MPGDKSNMSSQLLTTQNKRRKSGFTLIEVIVAMGIFTTVSLIAVNLFVTVSGVQKRIASTQRIQEDMRYVIEAVAQQIRLGSINYYYYMDPNLNGILLNGNACTAGVDCAIDLYPDPAASSVTTLALIDQSGSYIYFSLRSNTLQYCKKTTKLDPCGPGDWLNITPSQVSITGLRFIITPSADPFVDPGAVYTCHLPDLSCDAVSGTYQWKSYRCSGDNSPCKYYSDGGNLQPKVRIIMRSQGAVGQPRDQGKLSLETIVSTRQIMSGVINKNY